MSGVTLQYWHNKQRRTEPAARGEVVIERSGLIASTVRPALAPTLRDGRAVELVLAESLVDLVVRLAQPELEGVPTFLDGVVRWVRLHVFLKVTCTRPTRIESGQGIEQAEHGRLLVLRRLRREVGHRRVEERPGMPP